MFCFHCGQVTAPKQSFGILIIESRSGKLGWARLHNGCAEHSISRYPQVVQWEATVTNLSAFKRLHNRIALENGSVWGSVPIVLA